MRTKEFQEPKSNRQAADHKYIDALFSALSDGTRRSILSHLAEHGESSVTELAAPFAMSQPAISRHLKVLQTAGLIERHSDRQRRLATLNADAMTDAVAWLNEFSRFWTGNFDQPGELLGTIATRTNNKTGPTQLELQGLK